MGTPQISISIKPAPLDDVRDPQFQQAARDLEDLHWAAPVLRDALADAQAALSDAATFLWLNASDKQGASSLWARIETARRNAAAVLKHTGGSK